ncbi:MAG: hypothetical protein M3P98_01150 [bacterium]|nr:hypothetical protein [bacterium]
MDENKSMDWHYLTHDSRAVVYLVWWVISTFGFITTHFYQKQQINGVWFVLTLIGLGVMFKLMPLKISNMRNILICWTVVLFGGIAISGGALHIKALQDLVPYLGSIWMLVLAIGYLWNGLIDQPMKWYMFAVVINVVGAALAYYVDEFMGGQYLVAAIVSFWSMGYLWLYRSEIL